jgi:transposase-like protein
MHNYSGTKCPECESKHFEFVEDAPASSKWKFQYLRCSSCKTFLGLVPSRHTNAIVDDIKEDVDKIKRKLGVY